MRRTIERVYRLLLYAFPPSLRRQHGVDMRQCARDALTSRGLSAAPRLFIDLLFSVPREWMLAAKGVSVTIWINGLTNDITHACRLLVRSPGFTAAAVLTLALGIGANAAIFSLAEATLLRPLKVANPHELYTLKWSSSYPDYLAYTEHKDLFAGVAAASGGRVNAIANGRAELVNAKYVSGNYFGLLGVTPEAGRLLSEADDVPSGPAVGVLDYRWWQARFGGDPSVIGASIRLNSNVPVTIVGVAPRSFTGTALGEATRLYAPITLAPRLRTGFFARADLLGARSTVWIRVIARLKPGVSAAAASAAMNATYRQFHQPRPGGRADVMELAPLLSSAFGEKNQTTVTRFVVILAGVVGCTLLIGCANLANLLLSRAAARQREIGVRIAIGAGRARIVRQLLIESVTLSAVGGAAGLFVTTLLMKALAGFQLPGGIEIDRLDLRLNGPALAFTAGVAIATGLLFGLAPAWRASRTDLIGWLRDDSRASTARGGLRSSLVAAQVALSLVLLAGTGLFIRSLAETLRVPLGFRVDNVVTASVNLGVARYDRARAAAFYTDGLSRVRRLPNVRAAAWSTLIPTNGNRVFTAKVDGYTAPKDAEVYFYTASVGPEYFAAAGTQVLRGRTFTGADTPASASVGIVNQTAARTYWPGREAIGGRLAAGDGKWIEVVGIAEDVSEGFDREIAPMVYLPFSQEDSGGPVDPAHLLVRTAGDATAMLGAIAEQLQSIDRDAPVYDVNTFAWRVRTLVMPQKMGAALFGFAASLALALAAIGIYGVASYVATLRTREIGIRVALGARPSTIRALILRQGSIPIAVGLAVGVVLAMAASQFATAFLRGVQPRDPLTYIAVVTVLAAIALAATWIPARRAARLDPVAALRQD